MRNIRKSAVFLLIILIITTGIFGAQAMDPKVPNPTNEFYCNDFADVLSSRTEDRIVSLGERINKASEGGQIVFVSVKSLNGSSIEEYANALFNKWKVGAKDKGVLFLISMQERKSRIEVGYGYEGALTDLQSNKLLRKFSELSKEKGMDAAVEEVYADIASIITGNEDAVRYYDSGTTRNRSSSGDNVEDFIRDNPIATAIFVILIILFIIMDFILTGGRITFMLLRMAARSGGRGGGGGGGRRNSGGGGRSGGGGSSSGF